MADGIHPTRNGYEFWWGPKFEEYILFISEWNNKWRDSNTM